MASSAGVGMVKRAPFMWVAVGGVGLGHAAQERKDVLGDDLEHGGGIAVLQPRPAHFLVSDAAASADLVLAGGEDAPLDRLAQPVGLVLLAGMRLVQPAHEQQVGDLLDHLQGIGDAARPEGVPDAIDLVAQFTCEHCGSVCYYKSGRNLARVSDPSSGASFLKTELARFSPRHFPPGFAFRAIQVTGASAPA